MESTLSPRQGAGKHTSPWPFVFVLLVLTGSVRAQTISRPIDEVVVRGSQIPALIGVPIDRIHLYRFNGSVFEPIPFQIDEIKTWILTDNISGCTETEIPADAKVCESNYAFDFSTGNPGGDTTAEFDANDEIVFMARDAGQVAGNCNWLGGDVDPDTRYVVELADERLAGC